jgi:hypothetical protein
MSILKTDRSEQGAFRKSNLWLRMEKGALESENQKISNDLVPGRMESGPGRVDNLTGIKTKRRWRRSREQFESQEGGDDDKRGDSQYLFKGFSEDAGGRKLRRLKTLIVKSLVNLIDSSR